MNGLDFSRLDSLTEGMDIPPARRHDIFWLARNLGVSTFNRTNPNYRPAMDEVKRLHHELTRVDL